MSWEIRQGDARNLLPRVSPDSVQTVVTSPPYFGLRDYENEKQIGLEETPQEYIDELVGVLREVKRVLREDGTLWLNLGDSYAGSWGAEGRRETPETPFRDSIKNHPKRASSVRVIRETGLKPKDLMGIPWAVAFALRDDGWYLRRDVIWSKPNPMPESVKDRPSSSHEYLFLLSKSSRYFYDGEAIKEPAIYGQPHSPEAIKSPHGQGFSRRAIEISEDRKELHSPRHSRHRSSIEGGQSLTEKPGRNKRSVWNVSTCPYPEAHFATFPPNLVRPCILAGSSRGDIVLDPFSGSGTSGLIAAQLGRDYIGIELNPRYVEMSEKRIGRWEANPAGRLRGEPTPIEGQLGLEIP